MTFLTGFHTALLVCAGIAAAGIFAAALIRGPETEPVVRAVSSIQVAVGAVYAWSVFRIPLTQSLSRCGSGG